MFASGLKIAPQIPLSNVSTQSCSLVGLYIPFTEAGQQSACVVAQASNRAWLLLKTQQRVVLAQGWRRLLSVSTPCLHGSYQHLGAWAAIDDGHLRCGACMTARAGLCLCVYEPQRQPASRRAPLAACCGNAATLAGYGAAGSAGPSRPGISCDGRDSGTRCTHTVQLSPCSSAAAVPACNFLLAARQADQALLRRPSHSEGDVHQSAMLPLFGFGLYLQVLRSTSV